MPLAVLLENLGELGYVEMVTPLDRNLCFNLPAVFPELFCNFRGVGCFHIDEAEVIPVLAVNPCQADHDGAPGRCIVNSIFRPMPIYQWYH